MIPSPFYVTTRTATLALVTWLLTGALSASAAAPLPFATARAELATVEREQVYDAIIEPVTQATVSAQTSGRIIEINFDVDDYVPKDSVLLRFRDTDQKARLAAEQATLREAQARFAEADKEYARVADVYQKKLVAKSELDKASADLKASTARLEAARARVQQAQEELDHTVVRAPYAGIVVKRQVEVGETANVGAPLMTGLSLEQLRATASVPQSIINTVREVRRARVILTTEGNQSMPGEVVTVSPYADPGSHTFKVRVDLPPGQHGVYPGMFAKVAFPVAGDKSLVVPEQAVVHRSEVTAVYVVDADRVTMRQIRLGRPAGDGRVVVLGGLEADEQVALDPVRAGLYLKEKATGDAP